MQKKIVITGASYYQVADAPLISGDFNAYLIVMPVSPSDNATGFMVEALRPDGSTITDYGQAYSDRCEYIIKNSIYAIPGEVRIRVAPLAADGKLTVRELSCTAVADFDGAQDVPVDRVPALTQAVAQVTSMQATIDNKVDKANATFRNGLNIKTTEHDLSDAYLGFEEKKIVASVYDGVDGTAKLILTPNTKRPGYSYNSAGSSPNSGEIYTTLEPPTKADIGLSNVDNTADADKPISKAVQSALSGKLDKYAPTVTNQLTVRAVSAPPKVIIANSSRTSSLEMPQDTLILKQMPDESVTGQYSAIKLSRDMLKYDVDGVEYDIYTSKNPINAQVQSALDVKVNKVQEAWMAPTLMNGWTKHDSEYATAGFYKDGLGVVHLRGFIKSGSIGTNAFTLPSGYRPTTPIYLPVVSYNAFGAINIKPTGEVFITAGSNAWVCLDGASFRVE